jgi:membrane protein insertase Oxa1/YidC/SpoIIIJ
MDAQVAAPSTCRSCGPWPRIGMFHEAVGNRGIAIIVLTIAVRVLTLYWTTRSMRSMPRFASQ